MLNFAWCSLKSTIIFNSFSLSKTKDKPVAIVLAKFPDQIVVNQVLWQI